MMIGGIGFFLRFDRCQRQPDDRHHDEADDQNQRECLQGALARTCGAACRAAKSACQILILGKRRCHRVVASILKRGSIRAIRTGPPGLSG